MNGSLAPSKSTMYMSNLPFSLTNNDLHQILKTHGKIVRVTIVKDRHTRKSRGIAFVLFLDRNEARECAKAMDNSQLFGRTVKASIAKDNGRAAEFIRRREYCDKSRCYECGEFGHLSYQCSQNALGEREPPPKKKRTRRSADHGDSATGKTHPNIGIRDQDNEDMSDEDDEALDSWSSVVNFQAGLATSSVNQDTASTSRRKIVRPAAYFSDEEEIQDEDD